MLNLLSDFVVDLVEMLEIPMEQLVGQISEDGENQAPPHIEDLIKAQLQYIKTIDKPE